MINYVSHVSESCTIMTLNNVNCQPTSECESNHGTKLMNDEVLLIRMLLIQPSMFIGLGITLSGFCWRRKVLRLLYH